MMTPSVGAQRYRCLLRPLSAAFSLIATLAALGCGGGSSSGGNSTLSTTNGSGTPFGHVVLVVEENHSYSEVIGSSDMPYLNCLASQYGLATQYFANTHPSIGNYFMLTTGQIVTNDDASVGTVTVDNIVRQLLAAGKTWKSYAENRGGPGYVKHHDPLAYFSDVVQSSTQMQNLTDLPNFKSDLADNSLPDFSFVVPNLANDGHDGPLRQADAWLKTNIAPLLASPAFQSDGLLIITFDESLGTDSAHGGGHIATVVVSPKAKKGFQSSTFYQHESTLRLILEGLGISKLPGAASSAPSMDEFF